MATRWRSAALLVVSCLGWGSAKADVTFTFYEAGNPSFDLLDLTLPYEPSSEHYFQAVPDSGGYYGRPSDSYTVYDSLGAPDYVLDLDGGYGVTGIVDFGFKAPPGNGSFAVTGSIGGADVGTATVSGVPASASAPEPSTWALILLGFAWLGFTGHRISQRTAKMAG